jgi:glucokinase
MKTILALDFGGTKLAAAVLDPASQRWLARGRCPSPAAEGAEAVLARMLALADAQVALVGVTPVAVGISFDGPVDVERGQPRACHHVEGWAGLPLRERVATHYGVPAVVENDARAAALGEWRYGAGRGCRSMLYVTVSTGIGGGILLDGVLYHGVDGLAGELGHMCLESGGALCACGRRGCLEALAAGPAIVRRAREALAASPDVPSAMRAQETLSAEEVSAAAQQGDTLARQALQGAARALGIGLGNALNLMNLERVVLGGGVTGAGPEYLASVRRAAEETALAGTRVEIVLAGLGGDAPMWGACALAETLLADH